MALRVPPPEIPVVTFLTPNKLDQGLIEFWNTELASYIPLDVGAPHPNSRQYPDFRLGNQRPVQGDEKWVIRTWVTDETSPDWFNYSLKFAGEDNAYPIFIRTYREPRETYTPRTKAAPLNALYKMVLTENGTGYANGAYPSITFEESSTPPTTVAIAHGVVAPDGSISECVLDFGGEGYEDDVAFTVASPISGTPASGIAYRQPVSAILINEQASLYPEDSPFYAQYLQVVRVYETLPGPPFIGTKMAEDGTVITTTSIRRLCSEITSAEALDSGLWCKVTKQPTDSDIVCEQVIECRPIPGNTLETTRIDVDGEVVRIFTTLRDETLINDGEVLSVGVWAKITRRPADSDLVSYEIVESRLIPGNAIDRTIIDDNGDIMEETRTMVQASTITTVNTVIGNVWTKTFEEPVNDSDIIAWKVIQVRETQNELNSYAISIPDLIPPEFRGVVPITTIGETLIGQASLPTLGTGEIEVEERELDAYTYRRTVSGRPDLELPITLVNQELTEEYGGGILDVTMTLDLIGNLTIDEGLTVVDSQIRNLGNGLGLKTTKELQDAAWPILESRLWDDNMRVEYDETRQVIVAGSSEDPDPGGVFAWVSEVKGLDKWRSLITNTSKPTPAYTDESNALISYLGKPYRFPGLLYLGNGGYYVRHADAVLVVHKLKTWWLKSATTPTVGNTGSGSDVEFDEIVMDDVVINNLTNTGLTYSGPVLHDDLQIGILNYPATTPSYTQYALGTPTGTALQNFASIYNPGTTGGYMVGDTITISSGGFTMSVDVTFVYDVDTITGLIGATTNPDPSGTYPAGNYGPIAASGGSGSGAYFNVFAISVPTYTPGTQWIGTYRVIFASVTPEREKDIWKVQTESVIMR